MRCTLRSLFATASPHRIEMPPDKLGSHPSHRSAPVTVPLVSSISRVGDMHLCCSHWLYGTCFDCMSLSSTTSTSEQPVFVIRTFDKSSITTVRVVNTTVSDCSNGERYLGSPPIPFSRALPFRIYTCSLSIALVAFHGVCIPI